MERYTKWGVLAAAILLLLFLFYWQTDRGKQKDPLPIVSKQEQRTEAAEPETSFVIADIKGAVKNAGVYELPNGSRVKEAIERAGGLLSDAETGSINLAQLVHDQMMIVVPKKGEQPLFPPSSEGGKVAINIATKEELEKIPGIGPKKAESILRYREEHGSFRKFEDLLEVEGIGEKSLEKLKDEIIVP
ncbi:helix-hairpin-helix domain-containing protein [Ectobacillus funiculus]|uniref:Helix-hairpin-helix domain-containing protein n=1 Tax=Ectobacillus funiculus TaxID=137993 RepID=A0ABV5WNJ7_9BACI